MSVVDDYLQKVDEPQKSELEHVRKIVAGAVPDAEEVITYGMPGFKYKGKYMISFGSFKDHMSIFPGSKAVGDLATKLKEFQTSKGTIQFTLDHKVPDELIKQIVLGRKDEIDKTTK